MKKLQKYLLQIMIFGILVSVIVPGIFYTCWYTNTQKAKVQELYAKDAYSNIEWLFNDFWNAKLYVESMQSLISNEQVTKNDLKDEKFLNNHLERVEQLSEELLFGIDYFYEIEYYINPKLTNTNICLYRKQQNNDTRQNLTYEQGKTNLDVAMNNATKAMDGLWLEPYNSKEDNTMVIAYIQSIYLNNGELLGVVGITYDYNKIKNSLIKLNEKSIEDYGIYSKYGIPTTSIDLPQIKDEDLQSILDVSNDQEIYSCKTSKGSYTIYAYQLMDDEYIFAFISNQNLYKEHYKLLLILMKNHPHTYDFSRE